MMEKQTKLERAIKASGLMKKFIAKKAKIPPQRLSEYISGDREMSKDIVKKLAIALSIPQDQIQ